MIERYKLYLSRPYWLFRLQSAKEFAREHPWWLEVGPLAVLLAAIALPWFGYHEAVAHSRPWSFLSRSPEHAWNLHYSVGFWFVLSFWLGALRKKHRITHDDFKTFRGFPATQETISIFLLGCLFFYRLMSHDSLLLWIIIGPFFTFMQYLIERRWPISPLEATRDDDKKTRPGAEDIRPGEHFYYRESSIPMNGLGCSMLAGLACLILLEFVNTWWIALIPIALLAMVFWRAVTMASEFSVSNECVRIKMGKETAYLSIEDIGECKLKPQTPGAFGDIIRENLKTHILTKHFIINSSENCLLRLRVKPADCPEFITEYVLTVKEPETACKLIQTALDAKKQGGSADTHQ